MKVRWILSREAKADLERLIGRPVTLAELRPRHPIAGDRPVWRLGRSLHRIHLITVEDRRAEPGVIIRTIVEATAPHEGWQGPASEGARPSKSHRDLAHIAQSVLGETVSPADVRDMPIHERRRLLMRLGFDTGRATGGELRARVRALRAPR